MITAHSTTEIEVAIEQTRTNFISLRCTDDTLVTMMGIDPGDGYRPFHPLLVKVDGTEQALPLSLSSGLHSLELIGEPFDGYGLLLVGHGLHNVTDVSVGGGTAELNAQVAAIPAVKSASRNPGDADLTGVLGTQWLNTFTGFWFKEIPGAWQQQP